MKESEDIVMDRTLLQCNDISIQCFTYKQIGDYRRIYH